MLAWGCQPHAARLSRPPDWTFEHVGSSGRDRHLELSHLLTKQEQATLADRFKGIARRHPDRPCVFVPGATYSYHEIASIVARTATALAERGFRRGMYLGIALPSSPALIATQLAVLGMS